MAPPRSRKTRETWGTRRPNHSAEQERIAYLEKKIQTKDEVLAERMAEHVALKKRLGNSDRGLGSARYAGPDRGFHPARFPLPGFPRFQSAGAHPLKLSMSRL